MKPIATNSPYSCPGCGGDCDSILHGLQAAFGQDEYSGLTDCQICVLESLKLDGPAPTATLQHRLPAYNAMAGIPRPQWFTPAEVQQAVDSLINLKHIIWTDAGFDIPVKGVTIG